MPLRDMFTFYFVDTATSDFLDLLDDFLEVLDDISWHFTTSTVEETLTGDIFFLG